MKIQRNPEKEFWYLLAMISLFTVGIVLYGVLIPFRPEQISAEAQPEEDIYILDGRTLAEFQPVILEKFHEESELVVLRIEAEASANLKQAGIVDWSILNKAQSLTYRGTGYYYVNMNALSSSNITMDNQKQVIRIRIPHTELSSIEMDPEQFEASETEKGFLAFGEIRLTPQEYNSLEKEARKQIYEEIDREENQKIADKNALEEMKKIYEPLIKVIDGNYSLEISFVE